jgi:hypothetical protein
MGKKFLTIVTVISIVINISCINNNKKSTNTYDYLKSIDPTLNDKVIIYFCEIARWQGDYTGNKRIMIDSDFYLYYAKNIPAKENKIFNGQYQIVKRLTINEVNVLYDFFVSKYFNTLPDTVLTPSNISVSGGSDSYLWLNLKDIHKGVKFEPETAIIPDFLYLVDKIVSAADNAE